MFQSLNVILASLLAAVVFAAPASAAPLSDAELTAAIVSMEGEGRPAAEMVILAAEQGRTVADATALVVAAGSEPATRSHGTLFGMCLAEEKNELARSVGQAALNAAAEDDQEVQTTVASFSFDQCHGFLPYLRPGQVASPRPALPDSPSR